MCRVCVAVSQRALRASPCRNEPCVRFERLARKDDSVSGEGSSGEVNALLKCTSYRLQAHVQVELQSVHEHAKANVRKFRAKTSALVIQDAGSKSHVLAVGKPTYTKAHLRVAGASSTPDSMDCDAAQRDFIELFTAQHDDTDCRADAFVSLEGSSDSGSNGEQICEGHGHDEATCNSIGCCQYDIVDGKCWSDVGQGPCTG
jgi:hypothetical protein